MKDGISIIFLALLIGAWITLHAKRTKEKKKLQKDTKEILLERFKDAVMPARHDGQKAVGTEEISDLPQEIKGSRKRVNPYHQKEYRSGKERRKNLFHIFFTDSVTGVNYTDKDMFIRIA